MKYETPLLQFTLYPRLQKYSPEFIPLQLNQPRSLV